MSVIAALLCIVYAVIVTYGGFQYVSKMYDVGIEMQDMPVQQWIPRAILPVGFALLAFRFTQVLLRLLSGKEAHLLGDEAKDALKLKDKRRRGEQMTTVILFVLLFAFMFLGMPVAVALGLSSLLTILLLRAGLAGLAVAEAVRDVRALHAAGDPVLHSRPARS
jgi:membrane protein insertase Oxa1/YidC/SpoIIIJ